MRSCSVVFASVVSSGLLGSRFGESLSFGWVPLPNSRAAVQLSATCRSARVLPAEGTRTSTTLRAASTPGDSIPGELISEGSGTADVERRRPFNRRATTRAIRQLAKKLARVRRDRLRQRRRQSTTFDVVVGQNDTTHDLRHSSVLQDSWTGVGSNGALDLGGATDSSGFYSAGVEVVSTTSTTTALPTIDVDGNVPVRPTNKANRRARASTINGRPIVKGKSRGLWGSIFGPRPLLEVCSVEELSRLIDDEGWRLEDLSVVTGANPAARQGGADLEGKRKDAATAGVADGRGLTDRSGVELTMHPVVQAVLERAAAGTLPSGHADGRRIGLAIEGGGMRGCVAAGMASCLHCLGLADSFDGVYGASAGSLVGAYFVSRQPNGTAVYHDVLPSAGTRFIDMAKFPQALGFGLPKVDRGANNRKAVAAKGDLDPGREGAESLGSPYSARFARVIRLDFLLGDVVGRIHRLDFEAFAANDKLQPLHVVTSGVNSMSSVSLASRRGHFATLDKLTECIRASMLVPGLAGPLLTVPIGKRSLSASRDSPSICATEPSVKISAARTASKSKRRRKADSRLATDVEVDHVDRRQGKENDVEEVCSQGLSSWVLGKWWPRRRLDPRLLSGHGSSESGDEEDRSLVVDTEPADGADGVSTAESELLVDAMIFEPLPYRSAVDDGCTDVLVLCTRPEGSQVLGKKPSLYETRVVKKYFEQHEDPAVTANISDHLRQLKHLRTYAEDALLLRDGSHTWLPQKIPQGGPGAGREAYLLAIAPEASCKEVGQLEMNRKTVLQGCRDGFSACYDIFVGPEAAAAAKGARSDADEKIGEWTRHKSGAAAALEYFPDSLLSVKRDLDVNYSETGGRIRPADISPARATSSATVAADAAIIGNSHDALELGLSAPLCSPEHDLKTIVLPQNTSSLFSEGGEGRGWLRRLLSLGLVSRSKAPSASPSSTATASFIERGGFSSNDGHVSATAVTAAHGEVAAERGTGGRQYDPSAGEGRDGPDFD